MPRRLPSIVCTAASAVLILSACAGSPSIEGVWQPDEGSDRMTVEFGSKTVSLERQ